MLLMSKLLMVLSNKHNMTTLFLLFHFFLLISERAETNTIIIHEKIMIGRIEGTIIELKAKIIVIKIAKNSTVNAIFDILFIFTSLFIIVL